MPPAVAQAPIVTSSGRGSRRSRTISSACSGVLIEPSTRRTSNGPDERREVASANSTMSNRSAIASRSSSRSRSVSWQPSHDANLTTPTRGRRGARAAGVDGRSSEALPSKAAPSSATREDRAVPADEEAAELAVAAQADAARHVPLERQPGAARRRCRGRAATSTVACIIRSGPQMKATAFAAIASLARSNSWVTTPTRPSHSGPARSTICATSMSPCAARATDLGDEQAVGRGPGAEEEADRADTRSRPARTSSMSGRSGASPMPPATITTSRPVALDRPATTQRPAEAELSPRLRRVRAGSPGPRRGW